ncbi:MAG TPA: nuclear transport factor 2 family protein [Actinomycetota bacterium]|nr:nuclear transport factor 2 family protein [Actinomycetota bacterium]
MAEARAALERWLDGYGRAWERQDAQAFADLFTEDALYQETPFDEPLRGRTAIRAYAETAAHHQRDVSFAYEALGQDDGKAVVLWRAAYEKVSNGEPTRLEGVFLLEFAADGLCRSLREWWHADPSPSFTAAGVPRPRSAAPASASPTGSRPLAVAVLVALAVAGAVIFLLFR